MRFKLVPIDDGQAYPHEKKAYRDKIYREAENIQDLERNSPTLWIYKNTRTPWHESYWTKYERKRVNKSSRMHVKEDLKKDPENIQDRPNLKI